MTEPGGERPIADLEGRVSRLADFLAHLAMGDLDAPWTPTEREDPLAEIEVAAELLRGDLAVSQRELRESEARYRELVERLPAVVYTAVLDEDVSTTYVSPGVLPLAGYTPEEWLADPALWAKLLHPEDRDRTLAAFRQLGVGDTISIEYRLVARDGTVRWFRDDATVSGGEDGGPGQIRGVLVEITETKALQAALERARDGLERRVHERTADLRAANAAFAAAEERYRTLVEQLPAITYLDEIDPASPVGIRPIFISPQVETILGYAPDELLARPERWDELRHPDDRAAALARDLAHYASGEPLSQRHRMVARDGRVVWVQDEGVFLRDKRGRPRYSQGVVFDITDRVRAEEARRAAEQRYRTLVEQLPGITYIDEIEADGTARFVYVSPQARDLLGYEPAELVARPELWDEVIHPDDRGRARSMYERGRALGQPPPEEYRLITRDGRLRWFHDEPRFLPDVSGTARLVHGVLFDVTHLKAAEEEARHLNVELERRVEERTAALGASEARWRTLVENMPEYVWTIDREGRIRYLNRATPSFGVDELTGVNLLDLVPEEARRGLAALRDRVFAGGETATWELSRPRPDGATAWYESHVAPIRAEGAEIAEAIVVTSDVTERKRVEEDLRAARDEAELANRAKSEMLSRMSHELRTPMNAILGFGQLLELSTLAPADRESVEQIMRAGRRLLDLINRALDITRLDSGRLSLSIEPVEVEEVVREVADLVRPNAMVRGVTLQTEEAERCGCFVLADQERLKTVLLNLLSNAVRFNHQGGSATVTCEEVPDDRLRIAVADTGPGIAAERLPDLFTPFQPRGPAIGSDEGAGVGLALARRLAEAMGGSIGVESEVGRGSVFHVELPLAEDPLARARPESGPGGPVGPRRVVLYIEDDLVNVRLVQRFVARRPDVQVDTAMTGRMGLDLASSRRPDLIVLELGLPDMRGEEVLATLRADPATAAIPVIVASSDPAAGQEEVLRAAGARAFLGKPFEVDAFLELLDELLPREAAT